MIKGRASISGVWCYPHPYCCSKDRIAGVIYGEIAIDIRIKTKIVGVMSCDITP
jgi:hypothetical protein